MHRELLSIYSCFSLPPSSPLNSSSSSNTYTTSKNFNNSDTSRTYLNLSPSTTYTHSKCSASVSWFPSITDAPPLPIS